MNLASSIEDDDTDIQFHELFERTFNRTRQSSTQILEKWKMRHKAWSQRSPGGMKDQPWNIVHFPAFISSTLTSSPGTAAAKKKIDRENAVLWDKYMVTVHKYIVVATSFDFVLNEPAYWTYAGAEDSRVSVDTLIQRCLKITHQSQIHEGKSLWKALSFGDEEENTIAIGSRLRYGRGQKPVVHHFAGVPV